MKLLFLALICITSLFSCISDDSSSYEESWSLVNFSGGLLGVNQTYELGDIEWRFDFETHTVIVIYHIVPNPNDFPPYPSEGTYPFEWVEENGNQVLKINGVSMGNTSINGNYMTIDDDIAADGFMYTLVRMD